MIPDCRDQVVYSSMTLPSEADKEYSLPLGMGAPGSRLMVQSCSLRGGRGLGEYLFKVQVASGDAREIRSVCDHNCVLLLRVLVCKTVIHKMVSPTENSPCGPVYVGVVIYQPRETQDEGKG